MSVVTKNCIASSVKAATLSAELDASSNPPYLGGPWVLEWQWLQPRCLKAGNEMAFLILKFKGFCLRNVECSVDSSGNSPTILPYTIFISQCNIVVGIGDQDEFLKL